jgi:hypothetical protein
MPALPTESSTAVKFKSEAQNVLDELHGQQLIPFKLTAFKVESIGRDQYMSYFHDGRLPALMVSWVEGKSFRDVFRAVILDHVSRME